MIIKIDSIDELAAAFPSAALYIDNYTSKVVIQYKDNKVVLKPASSRIGEKTFYCLFFETARRLAHGYHPQMEKDLEALRTSYNLKVEFKDVDLWFDNSPDEVSDS